MIKKLNRDQLLEIAKSAKTSHGLTRFALVKVLRETVLQRKGKNQELIQTTEILNFVLCSSSRNHSTECFERKISHDLREYQLSSVHDHPRQITSANDDSSWKSNSNRGHQKMGIYL